MKPSILPAPWSVRPARDSGCTVDIVACSGSLVAVSCEEEAPIIAAAPELLEACLAFVAAENERFSRDIFSPEAQPESPTQKACLLARAAIAKATK